MSQAYIKLQDLAHIHYDLGCAFRLADLLLPLLLLISAPSTDSEEVAYRCFENFF